MRSGAVYREKSQIQALDRTAPILPLRRVLPERQTHDYKRYGTITLFAAFNILNGKVIGSWLPRHRGKEFAKFLNQLESQRTGTNAYDGRVKTPELGIAAADDRHSVMHVYARHHVRLFANYREPGMPPRPEPQHSVRELHGEAS